MFDCGRAIAPVCFSIEVNLQQNNHFRLINRSAFYFFHLQEFEVTIFGDFVVNAFLIRKYDMESVGVSFHFNVPYVSGEFGVQRDQRDQQVFPFQDEQTK